MGQCRTSGELYATLYFANFKKYSKLLPNFVSSEFLATYFCYFFDDFKKNIANFCSSEFLATYFLTISKNIANFVIGHPITRRFGKKHTKRCNSEFLATR